MSDARLLSCAQAGDKAAVQTLYLRFLPSVWRYAYSQSRGDVHAAEDLVAETFLAALGGLDKLDPEHVFLAGWLIGIARNKLADRQRQARRTEQWRQALRDHPKPLVDSVDGPALLEAQETRDEVGRIMDRLPDEERLALEWKYLEKLSVREIAGRLGRTEKAVEALLYRARNAFRESWQLR